MENLKIFEMPLPGYLGFPAFALECFTMFVFVRGLAARFRASGSSRPVGIPASLKSRDDGSSSTRCCSRLASGTRLHPLTRVRTKAAVRSLVCRSPGASLRHSSLPASRTSSSIFTTCRKH